MAEPHFSKLDSKEKQSRFNLLAHSQGQVTIWIKGQKLKKQYSVLEFDKDRSELILDSKEDLYPEGAQLLCTFELRGMQFFFQCQAKKSVGGHFLLEVKNDLFKSEKRGSYRLLTYPIYDVYSIFNVEETYQGGKVINLRSKSGQTALFKNFLSLIDSGHEGKVQQTVKYRVQDLSTTGMSLHIGQLESQLFTKDYIFREVELTFPQDKIIIPEVKVIYIVDYIGGDQNLKMYKIGLHFVNLPSHIDDQLGRKINQLLREIDFNKDFENFTK